MLLIPLLALLIAPSEGAVAEVEIVVHPDTAIVSINRAELSRLFLKRLRTWADGRNAVPVDQVPDRPAREEFSRVVHDRSVVTIEVYWKRMIFSGRGVPPPEVASDEEVLHFVRTHPGAVGYVTKGTLLRGVRALELAE